jgi:hypothetical protein
MHVDIKKYNKMIKKKSNKNKVQYDSDNKMILNIEIKKINNK